MKRVRNRLPGYEYMSDYTYSNMIKYRHEFDFRIRDGIDVYKCPVCGSYYPIRSIRGHIYLNHTKAGVQSCVDLGKRGKEIAKTPEVRDKIRKKLSAYYKEHPRFYSVKQKESTPERLFREAIEDLKLPFEIYQNYSCPEFKKAYELNFAIPSLRIYFEVNGGQHYTSTGEYTDYHIKRKYYIESYGWVQIDVDYSMCFERTQLQDYILRALNLDIEYCKEKNSKVIDYRIQKVKDREEKEIKERLEKDMQRINDIRYKFLLIINSDVDFTKYGWVSDIIKLHPELSSFRSKMVKWLQVYAPEFLNMCYLYSRDRSHIYDK